MNSGVFQRYFMCDNASNWMQKQIWEVSCFLLHKALKGFVKMYNNASLFWLYCQLIGDVCHIFHRVVDLCISPFSFDKICPFSFRFALYTLKLLYLSSEIIMKYPSLPLLQFFALKDPSSGINIVTTVHFLYFHDIF